MSGFVDPAFKHLKVTEPNFLVWRISKLPEENYEAKVIKSEFWGFFCEEDTYIVFSSSRVKKPFARSHRREVSKMEINIHFWLGSKSTEDERRRTIIKAIEVDDVLEGAGVLHREMQGYESDRFLSYFKTGMFIMRGEITAVLRQTQLQTRAKLFKLSERGSTPVLTEYPTISWTFITTETVAVLELSRKIFVWLGREASSGDRSAAFKYGSYAQRCRPNKNIVWVVDEKEKELPAEDIKDFEDFLSLKCKTVEASTPHKNLVLLNTKTRKNTELYKVIGGEDGSIVIYIKDGPLLQSDLNSMVSPREPEYEEIRMMEICLVHHYTNCVWVWVSRKVPENERSRAINIGIAYLDKKPKSDYFDISRMNVARVVEGTEPVEFKLLFRSWSDTFPANENGYFHKAVARRVNAALTADGLEGSPYLAAESQLFDYGSGKMKILQVTECKLEPLRPEEFGVFHASFSYLVHYSYTVCGKTETILYYWLGSNAPIQEKENSIWASLKDIPDLKDANVRVRIEQNHETSHFHAIFQGKILVLTRSLPATKKNWSLDHYPIILLKIKGGDVLNTVSTEVEPRASSLNSFNVFLLRTPGMSFIWCGRSSKGDEREMAKIVARKWTAEYAVVVEGCETEEFWKLLGGFKCYSSAEEKVDVLMNVPPRAFKCSSPYYDFKVMEIINFAQSDFGSHDIIILDAWRTIFVWTGRDVPTEESFESEKLVKAYLNSDPSGRNLAIPIIHLRQNHEPAVFRGYFATWDTSSTVPNDVDLALRTIFHEKEKPQVMVEKLAEEVIEDTITTAVEALKPEPEKLLYPVDMLQNKAADEIPRGVDPTRKEEFISDDDFLRVFGIPRTIFQKLPQWKRKNLKVCAGLF